MKSGVTLANLVRIVIFPYFKEHRLKVILSIVGVALGVAVFIAIQSASVSADRAMKNFVTSISSNADLLISYGRNGLDESYFPKIVMTEGVELASPVISSHTRMRKGKDFYPVLVLGLDITKGKRFYGQSKSNFRIDKFLSQPNQVIVSQGFLKAYGLKANSLVHLMTTKGEYPFEIAGVIGKGQSLYGQDSRLVIIDFFSAQYHFQKENRIDRVDIKLKKGFTVDEVRAKLIAKLGPHLKIKTANEKVKQSGILYQSFKLNLTVVSMIALLAGMYLIFNTINTSILHRRKEIGILRALGATKSDIIFVFSTKGVIIGIIGSVIGIVFGWILAYFSVEVFTQKLSRNYLMDSVGEVYFSPLLFILGFLLGLGMTLVSSIIPALASLRITPVETIRSVSYEDIKEIRLKLFSSIGFVVLVLAYFSSQLKPIMGIPVFGFLSNFFIILGLSLLTPLFIRWLIQFIRPLLIRFFRVEVALAGENLYRSIGRNSITISTLMISIALVISIFTLIESYHYSIGKWFNNVNNADFSIVSGSATQDGDIFPMKENRVDSIHRLPMVKGVDHYRFYTASYKGYMMDIHSFKMDVAKDFVNYSFVEGDQESAFRSMAKEDAVLISENLASRFKLRKGDFITLTIKNGKHNFKIAGIVLNYLSSNGVVSMTGETFKKYWKDSLVDIFKIYLKKDTNLLKFRKKLYETVENPDNLVFTSTIEFKKTVLSAVDETFTMFHALELITIVIAIMGVVNALLASILERKREIGILRAIGATKKQIGRLILSEAGIIGFFSGIIGIVGGVLLSLVTVFVINKQTVGWQLEYSLPFDILVIVFISSVILTLFAGYYPSRKAFTIVIREALEYE